MPAAPSTARVEPSAPLSLRAPLSGVMVPLDQVPDPVFAGRMVGDGFSIDPVTSRLLAPIPGEVIDLQPSGHAITLRTAEGLEVLMHIGLDTVRMRGEGFTPLVRVGDAVAAGDPLIDFDLDLVAREAKSLLTQIVVTNSELLAGVTPATGIVTAGHDVAAVLEFADAPGAGAAGADARESGPATTAASEAILVPNPTGLHARPAATLVALAKSFTSEVRLRRGDDTANAKSIVSIMGMAVGFSDKVVVTAHGPDAEEAVAAIAAGIRDGLGEDCPPVGVPASPEAPPAGSAVGETAGAAPEASADADPDLLRGVSASPGLGVGRVLQLRHDEIDVAEFAEDRHRETRTLNAAIDRALLDLSALEKRLAEESDPGKAAIFAAHAEILADPDLLDLARSAIDKGKSAAFAWRGAYTTVADRLAGLSNQVLAGRADDVRDVGRRVLEEITGRRREDAEIAEGTILIAENLTPSDTARLDRTRIVGFATTGGGASSHVAIIARSLDIPAIAGIDSRALSLPDGTRVVLDGTDGSLRRNLSESEFEAVLARQRRIAERKATEYSHRDEPAVTTDGHRVAVVANIGDAEDAARAMTLGAEGVGLLRSEFVFMNRTAAPTVDEQARVYGDCARALAPGQPLVIRTLDAGGDKPVSYIPLPAEENPFLGIRGIRVGLERPELLRAQCRAALAAADAGTGADIHVMFPMIATIDDWRRAKAIFDEEREASGITAGVHVGIMMEVPSVAVMARRFAAEEGCDFFSVGTNDLTSYTLAMDRGHPKLAARADACNPAILALIGGAAEALHDHGKWIGVCGGIASDPQAVPILIGLGVDELSCSVPAIPAVKAAVRARSLAECRALATAALDCATPDEVRALVPLEDH